eukprot:CFRG5637T1
MVMVDDVVTTVDLVVDVQAVVVLVASVVVVEVVLVVVTTLTVHVSTMENEFAPVVLSEEMGVRKTKVLKEGSGKVLQEYCELYGKGFLHFKTILKDGRIIDDSRENNWPAFEIILGKKFKLQAWELAVKSMRVGEKAIFECSQLISAQPHSCVMKQERALKLSKGLAELLDEDILVFVLELISYSPPNAYQEQYWEVDITEKIRRIPILRDEGNILVAEKDYMNAFEVYYRAIQYLERVTTDVVSVTETDIKSVLPFRMPLYLNACLCCLKLNRFPEVIDYATRALEIDPFNVKALLRRGRIYRLQSEVSLARADLQHALDANGGEMEEARCELARVDKLDLAIREKERQVYKNLLA